MATKARSIALYIPDSAASDPIYQSIDPTRFFTQSRENSAQRGDDEYHDLVVTIGGKLVAFRYDRVLD